jgi:hypothetical protein
MAISVLHFLDGVEALPERINSTGLLRDPTN